MPRTPTSAGSSCAHQRGGNTQSNALSNGRKGCARRCTQFVSDVKNKLHCFQNKTRARNSVFYLQELQNYPPVLANIFAAPTSYLRCFVAPKQQQTLTHGQTDRKAGRRATTPLVRSTQSSKGRLLSHRAELFCQASGLQPSLSCACIYKRQRLQLLPVGATYTARATVFAVW